MSMAVYSRDLWNLIHAAIARIVLGGPQIQITPGKMVHQRGREDVVVVDPDDWL